MSQEKSPLITLNLKDHLTPDELKSFEEQAKKYGRTLQEHARIILLGLPEKAYK